MANLYKNKVICNGQTLIDLTADTVSADTLAEGITAHNAAGAQITGTLVAGGDLFVGSYTAAANTTRPLLTGFDFVPNRMMMIQAIPSTGVGMLCVIDDGSSQIAVQKVKSTGSTTFTATLTYANGSVEVYAGASTFNIGQTWSFTVWRE